MTSFLVLGAGRQGAACAAFLLENFTDTRVEFVDAATDRLDAATTLQADSSRVSTQLLGVSPVTDELRAIIARADCVISSLPFFLNASLTKAAIEAHRPFCDLGGNIATARAQLHMHAACLEAGVAIIPDCGLAPGLINVLAEYWSSEWEYSAVRLYCGGLPQNPTGSLKYQLTFSVYGLLNEYLEDCEVSRGGKLMTVPGLSGLEPLGDLAFPGAFEAFSTSGGASLGPQVYAPRGVDYEYKTIRYPGHCRIMRAMREMGLFDETPRPVSLDGRRVTLSPRAVVGPVMEASLRADGRDLVVARVNVRGRIDGQPAVGRIDLLDYAVDRFTAMERTTGFATGVVAAALAGLYDRKIEPGAYVPFQVIDPKLMIAELGRAGISGISVRLE